MRVSDILRKKGSEVATIAPSATIAEALALLSERGIGAIVASTDGQTIDGILSERDIVRAMHRLGADALDQAVSDLMTSSVHTCTAEQRVDQMMTTMTENRFRHMPVVDAEGLIGIISIGDVVATRVAELENETIVLEQYIHQGR